MNKILILGSEGFTGKYLFEFIKKNNSEKDIYLVDKIPKKLIKKKNYYQLDLLKKREILQFLKCYTPDIIFNFVGLIFSDNILELFKINVLTADNLLSSINEIYGYIPKVLLIGSAAEYGKVNKSDLPIAETCKKRPVGNYGLSKVFLNALANKYILNSKIKIFRAKTFNIIGPGLSEKLLAGSIALQMEKIRKGLQPNELYVGNLNSERDFIDIRDVVVAYWKIINSDFSGEVFNIGRGRPVKIRKIVENFIILSGLRMKIVKREDLLRKIDPDFIYSDITKLRKHIKWRPQIALEQSIKDMLKFEYLS